MRLRKKNPLCVSAVFRHKPYVPCSMHPSGSHMAAAYLPGLCLPMSPPQGPCPWGQWSLTRPMGVPACVRRRAGADLCRPRLGSLLGFSRRKIPQQPVPKGLEPLYLITCCFPDLASGGLCTGGSTSGSFSPSIFNLYFYFVVCSGQRRASLGRSPLLASGFNLLRVFPA